MGHGANSVFTKTMTSGATLTGEVDLGQAWASVYLGIPAYSGSVIHIQATDTSGGTYRRLFHPTLNSSTVGTNTFAVASAATNCYVPIPNGFRYLKVETTMAVADGCVFKIACSDS